MKPGPALRSLLLGVLLFVSSLVACRRHEPLRAAHRHPLIVIGVDGGEWKVVRRLWQRGQLPHLRALADRGVTAAPRTAYNSSPVIWTTIATGVRPEVHGITDFVVATPAGDVPVSSDVRRVPALWNMASRAGRKVAVLGWWASWPAEPVQGLVLSDRALLNLPDRISPATYLPQMDEDLQGADRDPGSFGLGATERQDRLMARTASKLARQSYDLILLYIRSLDVVSHHSWKGFEPEAFPEATRTEISAVQDDVPRIYRAVDDEIGRIVGDAPKDANIVVLSDHGFHAAKREEIRAWVDFDALIQELGYLKRSREGIDFARTKIYTYASPEFRRTKMLRFSLAGREPGGTVVEAERRPLTERLAADLTRVTNELGEPLFSLRDVHKKKGEDGDLAVVVALHALTPKLRLDGKPLQGVVGVITKISGTHTSSSNGIFFAAGPDIDRGAKLEGIHVQDMAPTFLYAVGLPVAEDFAGHAWTDLFTPEFRAQHPLRKIATWGSRKDVKGASRSQADEKLLDDLRSLGYIQ